MRTSEAINEISTALAKAQGEIQNPAKDAQNPHFKSFYADLASGINAIREALPQNGLAYVQATRLDGEVLMVDTRITHSSGQWIESEFPACRFPSKPQEVGSALTYARRYALFALCGIAGEDDGGNAANTNETPAQAKRQPPQPPKPPVESFDQEASQVTRDIMIEAISMANELPDLEQWVEDNKANIGKLMRADKNVILQTLDEKEAELKGKAKAA